MGKTKHDGRSLHPAEAASRARRFEHGYSDIFVKPALLENMTTGELIGLRRDASLIREAHAKCSTRLRQFIDSINHVIRRRTADPVEVSDHAVVRYLERIEGIDVQAIRDRIAGACNGSHPMQGEHSVAMGDGFYAVAKGNRVQTIMCRTGSSHEADPDE